MRALTLTFAELTVQEASHSPTFLLHVLSLHVPLLLSVPLFFPLDALQKMPFTLDTSRSFAVSCHLRTSKDSNLLFIMNKSLHCEKCLLFAPALKTTTGSSHSSCDCFAYFYSATPHRGGNWLYTVGERILKILYSTSAKTPLSGSRPNHTLPQNGICTLFFTGELMRSPNLTCQLEVFANSWIYYTYPSEKELTESICKGKAL